jgi:hypothetical protein
MILPVPIPTGYRVGIVGARGLWYNNNLTFGGQIVGPTGDPITGHDYEGYPYASIVADIKDVSGIVSDRLQGYGEFSTLVADSWVQISQNYELGSSDSRVGYLVASIEIVGLGEAWSHYLDFSVSDYGFIPGNSDAVFAQYSAGIGWVTGTTGVWVNIEHHASEAYTLTLCGFHYAITGSVTGVDTSNYSIFEVGSYIPIANDPTLSVPGDYTRTSDAVSLAGVSALYPAIKFKPGNSGIIYGVTVHGAGFDPFV